MKEHLVKEGQFVLPRAELIDRTEKPLDGVIDEAGRATIDAIVELVGPRRRRGEAQEGLRDSATWMSGRIVSLTDHEIRVN